MIYAEVYGNTSERNIRVSPKSFFHGPGLELITVLLHCSCPPVSVLQKLKFLKNLKIKKCDNYPKN